MQVLQPGFEACEYVFSNIPRNLVLNQAATQGDHQLMMNIMATNVMQSSKASHVIRKVSFIFFFRVKTPVVQILVLEDEFQKKLKVSGVSIVPKVIVFSQFYEFLDRVAVDLKEHGTLFLSTSTAFYVL